MFPFLLFLLLVDGLRLDTEAKGEFGQNTCSLSVVSRTEKSEARTSRGCDVFTCSLNLCHFPFQDKSSSFLEPQLQNCTTSRMTYVNFKNNCYSKVSIAEDWGRWLIASVQDWILILAFIVPPLHSEAPAEGPWAHVCCLREAEPGKRIEMNFIEAVGIFKSRPFDLGLSWVPLFIKWFNADSVEKTQRRRDQQTPNKEGLLVTSRPMRPSRERSEVRTSGVRSPLPKLETCR